MRGLPILLVGVCAVVLLMGEALLHPMTVLWGHLHSEAMGHLWRLEMATDGLARYGPLVTGSDQLLFPDGLYPEFTDVANLPVFAPVFWLTGSRALAWNALFLFWIGMSIVGSLALARRIVPDASWAPPVLIASSTAGAWWLGFDRAARTEYLPALLLPLHLAWLRDALQTDSRRAPWLAGLTLAGIALGGWYLAVFVIIVVAPVAIVWARAAPRRRAIRSLSTIAAIALALVAPAIAAFLTGGREVLRTQGSRALPPSVHVNVPGVASFFHELRIPEPPVFFHGIDQPAYPGVVALIGAILGALVSPPPLRRRVWGWLALVGWMLVWAAGFDLVLADETERVTHALPNLPRLLSAIVPVTAAITGWNRLGCMVGVPMGVALATALQAPVARWPALRRVVPLLVLAMIVDQLTWPRPLELRAATFDPHAPAGLVDAVRAIPPGALLLLPLDVPDPGEGVADMPPLHQHYPFWRAELGRAITSGYGGVDSTIGRSLLTRQALQIQDADARHRALPSVSPDLAACIGPDAARLRDLGIAAVVLVRSLPHASVLEPELREWLGVPVSTNADALAWDLAAIDVPAPGECPGVR
jgi:hypothetical protein